MGDTLVFVSIVFTLIQILFFVVFIIKTFHKVPTNKALVRSGMGGDRVVLSGGVMVVPYLHRIETIDLSLQTLAIERSAKQPLVFKDGVAATVKLVFTLKVPMEAGALLCLATLVGCQEATDPTTLKRLFEGKFLEAVHTIAQKHDFNTLYQDTEQFKFAVLTAIGTDLNGYELDDCAIEYLEPLALLERYQ